MRNIKVMALVLAVLMVMAAFAGCASKSTVEDLDERVSALEGKIDGNSGALSDIQSTLDNLNKAISDNKAATDKQISDVSAGAKKNEDDIKSVLDAIKDLQKSIEDTNKAVEDNKVEADKIHAVTDEFGAKINLLQKQYGDDRANYIAKDYDKIVEILGGAETAVSAATSEKDAQAIYDKMLKDLEAFKSVPDKLYSYIPALTGNIWSGSADLVNEAEKYLNEVAKPMYASDLANSPICKYTSKANGKTNYNTVDNLQALIDLAKEPTVSGKTTLKQVTDKATALVKKIDGLTGNETFNQVCDIYVEYKQWAVEAEKLSPKNKDLVTNLKALEDAQVSSLNSDMAAKVFQNLFTNYSILHPEVNKGVFADYDELVAVGSELKLYTYHTPAGTKAEAKNVYAAIDKAIADWIAEYKLTDATAAFIIDTNKGNGYYDQYKADEAFVLAMQANYEKAVSSFFKEVKSLNGKTLAGAVDTLKAYEANAVAIDQWAKDCYDAFVEAGKKNEIISNAISINDYYTNLSDNFTLMVKACLSRTFSLANAGEFVAADNNNYYALYKFTNADLKNFIEVDYNDAKAMAAAINRKIADLVPEQQNSIAPALTGIGGYVKADETKITALTAAELDASVAYTIANFTNKYKNSNYDLTYMLNTADYEAKVKEIEGYVKKIDDAAKKLNDQYYALFGNSSVAYITMDNYAAFNALATTYTDYIKTGARSDVFVAVETGTVNGVKEYKLEDVLADCYAINNPNYQALNVGSAKGVIYNADIAAKRLKAEADLAVSAYTAIKTLLPFGANVYNYDNDGVNVYWDTVNQVAGGKRSNFNTFGVSSQAYEAVKNSSGTTTAYKLTVKYLTFDGAKFSEKTYTKSDCPTSNTSVNANVVKFFVQGVGIVNTTLVTGGTGNANVKGYQTWLLDDTDTKSIPYAIYNGGIVWNAGAISDLKIAGTSIKNKCMTYPTLVALAESIYNRFMADNGGKTYKALEDAKKAVLDFSSDKNGLYLLARLAADEAKLMPGADTADPASNVKAMSTSSISGLKVMISSILNNATVDHDLKYFGCESVMPSDTLVYGGLNFYTPMADGYSRDGFLIYHVEVPCEHLSAVTSCANETVCPDCGAVLPKSDVHTKPAGVDNCTPYTCTVCHELIAASHTIPEGCTTPCLGFDCEECTEHFVAPHIDANADGICDVCSNPIMK